MKKFVAFAVATLFTAGASIAMAQCPTCSGGAAPVFSSAQPVYSAPAAPVYSQPAYSEPAYSEPVYSQPIASAPVYSAPVSSCNCGSTGGMIVDSGMVGGESTYTSGQSTDLYVGSVINGETVVSVGETMTVETTDSGDSMSGEAMSDEGGNAIEGSVEPSPDNSEVVSPPSDEMSSPSPDEGGSGSKMEGGSGAKMEATEGDA